MIEPIFELDEYQLKIIAKETWNVLANKTYHVHLSNYLHRTTKERHFKNVVHCKRQIEEYLTINGDDRYIQNDEITEMIVNKFDQVRKEVAQTVNNLEKI